MVFMATAAQKERQVKISIKEMIEAMDESELLNLTERLDKKMLASVLRIALEQILLEKSL